jgi:hypothetical protein
MQSVEQLRSAFVVELSVEDFEALRESTFQLTR